MLIHRRVAPGGAAMRLVHAAASLPALRAQHWSCRSATAQLAVATSFSTMSGPTLSPVSWLCFTCAPSQ